ncbi:MAG: hypothetical protein ABH821_01450, partial [archaeon]
MKPTGSKLKTRTIRFFRRFHRNPNVRLCAKLDRIVESKNSTTLLLENFFLPELQKTKNLSRKEIQT